ncbi:class I adenylate-forming enzyme family protein [Actinosynnema mirum]|nr:fatty acid--CoA ligase family protein [Actinosynnema mirum]
MAQRVTEAAPPSARPPTPPPPQGRVPPPLTARSMTASASGASAALTGHGVRAPDRVLLAAGNSPEFVAVLLGLLDLGVSVALADPGAPAAALTASAVEVGADWLVTDRPTAPGAPRTIPLADAAGDAGGALADPDLVRWTARADGLISWSSGSTGAPKAVVRAGAAIEGNLARTADRMGYRADDVLAPLLPFSHQYGMSMVLLARRAGCGLLVAPARLDRALPALAEHGVTVVDATPVTFRSALNLLARKEGLVDALTGVRMWCTGGAPLGDELARRFTEVTGAPLLDGYGSTELGNVALAGPGAPDTCLPLAGLSVRVLDERGAPAPPGVIGRVWVDSPDTASGVLADGVLVPRPPGPQHTHDLGLLDERGGLRVIGRERAVARRGHTLYPDRLAHLAGACGAPVQVVPLPRGEDDWRLVFVVEDPRLTAAAWWRARFGEVLARHELPDRVLVVAELPRLPSGKTDLVRVTDIVRSADTSTGQDAERAASRGHRTGRALP